MLQQIAELNKRCSMLNLSSQINQDNVQMVCFDPLKKGGRGSLFDVGID